jgi:hypothetical protein
MKYPKGPGTEYPVTASDVICDVEIGLGGPVPVGVGIGVEPAGISVTEGCEVPVDLPTNVPRTDPSTTASTSIMTTTTINQKTFRDGRDFSSSAGVLAPDLSTSFAKTLFSMTGASLMVRICARRGFLMFSHLGSAVIPEVVPERVPEYADESSSSTDYAFVLVVPY